MGIASVHYLSMNTPSGRETVVEPQYEGSSYTLTVDSLAPSTGHTIDWGDTTTDTGTTNGSGVLSHAHTYAESGTYEIIVTETVGGRKVAQHVAVVTVKLGTFVIPGSITESVAASFSGSGFDHSSDYTIHWGDTTTTTDSTDSSGVIGATSHTYALHGSYAITVVFDTTTAASGTAVVAYNDGVVTFTVGVVSTVEATLTGSSFAFNRSYDIDWGDGTSHDTVTSSGAGGFTHTHTYDTADTYDVVVKDGTHVSATLSQVVS